MLTASRALVVAGMVIGEWILNGEPPFDMWSFDIRRFGFLSPL